MKTITLNTFVLSLIVVLLTSIDFAYAQAPQKFSYQAVVRDGNGELATNQNIGMQISILEDSENGSAVYVERHFPTTNANGLVSLEIGTGTVISGDFKDIEWETNTYYVQNETDINGGSNYDITGTSQLLSVPYALYAENSGDGIQDGSNEGNTLYWDGNQWNTTSSFLFNDGEKIGIDTSTPNASLHINGEGGLLVTGQYNQGADLETSGAGTKLFFYPKKAAFRAGNVTGSQWDDNLIGGYSSAWGFDTKASGPRSAAWGSATEASGFSSTAWGWNTEAYGAESTAWGSDTEASGFRSTAWGHFTEASGSRSTAWGWNTEAIGAQSTAWGQNTVAKSTAETALGRFNTDYTPMNTNGWNQNDRLFGIGNGMNASNRSDAMVILKNGNTGIGISNPQHKLAVEVTTNTTPNGDGIGLVNTNNNNYWNIHMSTNWLRFSYNNNNVSYISNTGAYVQSSDKRLKENITPLEDGVLQKVNNINTVFYNYKNDENKVKTIGVIAQELKSLFPEFVFQDENSEYMGVHYAGLSVVTIKALQEQQSEIEELKAKNQALEQKINQILEELNN